jgi:TPR repeat protein
MFGAVSFHPIPNQSQNCISNCIYKLTSHNGEGCVHNLDRPAEGAAMCCYRMATEAGYLEAQLILAWNYLNGHGIARDTAAAALWFRKAAEQGDAGAQFQLAELYCTGTGVVRDLTEPVKWYRRSAEQGDRYAQYNLAIMLLKGQAPRPTPKRPSTGSAPPLNRVCRRRSSNLAAVLDPT